MDLRANYMGLELKNPLVVSACPLSRTVDNVRRMEDAGAAAVVMFSLFEEEIRHEMLELDHFLDHGTHSFAEALGYFPEHEEYDVGPHAYLEHVRALRAAVDIPIIGSLNGVAVGGWVEYARLIEDAGADALELNIYHIPTELERCGEDIEQLHLDIVRSVKDRLNIPVAVKLSPFFSSMAHMARQLDWAGADALVLFNRFYQPDIDLESFDVVPSIKLSTSHSMRLPLRWIAILSGRLRCDLAASSGIHSARDVLKMVMAGADVAMMASALLRNGIGHIAHVLGDMRTWMEESEYASLDEIRGSMSHAKYADPTAFERANYIKALNTYA